MKYAITFGWENTQTSIQLTPEAAFVEKNTWRCGDITDGRVEPWTAVVFVLDRERSPVSRQAQDQFLSRNTRAQQIFNGLVLFDKITKTSNWILFDQFYHSRSRYTHYAQLFAFLIRCQVKWSIENCDVCASVLHVISYHADKLQVSVNQRKTLL